MKKIEKKSGKLMVATANIVNSLYQVGYIDARELGDLKYRIGTGDLSVYKEVRTLLLELAEDFSKI